jgi:hypothetical protein
MALAKATMAGVSDRRAGADVPSDVPLASPAGALPKERRRLAKSAHSGIQVTDYKTTVTASVSATRQLSE